MDKGYTGEVTVKISIENGKIKIVNLDNKTQTINYDVKDLQLFVHLAAERQMCCGDRK